MKYILVALSLSILAKSNCKKAGYSIPLCILPKIDSIKAQPKWNPPAEVDEYKYNGKKVYFFTSNCCDQFNMLYDNNCNPICAPSGGFAGHGDGECVDFFKTAKLVRVIWKDER